MAIAALVLWALTAAAGVVLLVTGKPAGQHPLLEFSHPALGVTGLGCWFGYVGTGYRPLAWVAFAVVMLTAAAGLGWLASSRPGRAAAPATAPATGAAAVTGQASFPLRVIVAHGLGAALTLTLAVITAATATGPR